ncbi:MAG: CocE/NonD family hydrolase [Pseudonocardia sp.]|nr:CocE/NonD family hydrolase [Pseudonocardia sp.]
MSYRIEKDVKVQMRDGQMLATDLWIPDGGPAPTLLVRTPYGKDVPNLLANALNVGALLEAGYAVVFQDGRGTYRSGGEFTPMVYEPEDGADTVAWLHEQPWCDGNVGTYGASYLGFVQWALASQAPSGLKAIAPTVTTTDYYTSPWYSDGGALSLHMSLWWSTLLGFLDAQRALAAGTGGLDAVMELAGAFGDLESRLATMPYGEQPALDGRATWWSEWVRHPDRDGFWQDLSVVDRADRVTVPALNVGGWFDIFAGATTSTFTRMRAEAGSPEAQEGQRLIMGPWDHLSYTGAYHDRQFGMGADIAVADLTGAHIAFFDRWVRGHADALDGTAPVRIFVMGIDEWRDEQDWPLPDTRHTDYFLGGSGRANTAAGDGVLTAGAPGPEAGDTFTYDPADPVSSVGGRLIMPSALNAVGPVDQRPVESRDDVLCFTTPVLQDPVEVTGHISLVLHVASSAVDTDFTGKLVDVHPDGRAIYLTDGILRTRYRNSLARPELLEPEQVYEVTLDLSVTSNVFLPGHRIRLEVSSSNFPRYDRNTNTGGVISEESAEQAVVAVNRVLHGREHPSRLILPIIDR